jgi:hypothetical protein
MLARVNHFVMPRACLAAALVVCAAAAAAQDTRDLRGSFAPSAPAESAPPPQSAPVQPTPPGGPALLPSPSETISAIGRFIGAGVKGAGETLSVVPDAAGDIAKGVGDAAGTIARLPATNVIKGWERCTDAPNGAPDCEVATLAMCKANGFARGSSLDITSAYKCPAQLWREGRQPNDAECKQESFVSRALCQ